MFSNLSWYEVVALLLIALFIFGDKLPKMIGDGLRMLRNLRRMAQNATSDLSRELGTEIQLEDLNPRSFVRRHVLSEADQEKLMKPLKGVTEDVRRQTEGVQRDLKEVGQYTDRVTGQVRKAASGRGQPSPTGQPGPTGRALDPPAPPPRAGYDDIT